MSMRYHHQNLSDGKMPLWRYGRAWWKRVEWGWAFFKRSELLMFSLRRWGFAIYLRSLGHFYITIGADHDTDFDRSNWEIRIGDGCVWLEHPWVRANEWRRDDPWWRKQIVLHVVDWILGKQRCETTEGKPFEVFVPLPEGSYRAVATPETRIWRRRWYWPQLRRDSVDLRIEGGIPFAGKGESEWNCGDDGLWGTGGDTVEHAIANVVRSVLDARRKHGYDSKQTGRTPIAVLNPTIIGVDIATSSSSSTTATMTIERDPEIEARLNPPENPLRTEDL